MPELRIPIPLPLPLLPLHPKYRKLSVLALCVAAVFGFAVAVWLASIGGAGRYAAPATFSETWDGSPTSPQAWRPTTWGLTILPDGPSTTEAVEPMAASHGPDCAGPPATHQVTVLADAAFLCRDHLMTAANGGYMAVYLTPPAMMDFSTGESVLRFDMSTFRASARDWMEVLITPYEDNLTVPFNNGSEPRTGIRILMINGPTNTDFRAFVLRDYEETEIAAPYGPNMSDVFRSVGLAPDSARRDTFELRVSRTHIRFGMPGYNRWWIDNTTPDLGWARGVVQLNHYSYNSSKACGFDGTCGPNTWHWDNVSIAPSVPLTIIPAAQRRIDANQPEVVFPRAAPANARLNITVSARNPEYSTDAGATWRPLTLQVQNRNQASLDLNALRSAWVPVPPGTQRIRFRGQDNAWSWVMRDPMLWSTDDPGPAPGATATPELALPTATRTPTPVPGTATNTPTVTPTRTATPAGPTVTPGATATPPAGAPLTITFDAVSGQDRPLQGQEPAGVLDWGSSGQWWLSSPWGQFSTKSISFTEGRTSGTFTVLGGRHLVSMRVYNGASAANLVSLACAGMPTVSITVPAGAVSVLTTGWTQPCGATTMTSANGWNSNADDLVLQ